MPNDLNEAAAEGVPVNSRASWMLNLPEELRKPIERRIQFERMMHKWRTATIGLGPDASSDDQKAWEAKEADDARMQMARDVLHFPVPVLCLLRDKLDILIHHASTAGEDMWPTERLILDGILALRADVVDLGG